MFPHTQDPPARGAKRPRHQLVACLVARDLLPPEFRIVLRLRAVLRAPVDEDGDFQFPENEIGFAG